MDKPVLKIRQSIQSKLDAFDRKMKTGKTRYVELLYCLYSINEDMDAITKLRDALSEEETP